MIDASVIYKFYLDKGKKIRARAGVSALNLYNRGNEIDKIFRIDFDEDDNPVLEQQTRIGLGITPNAVFRVSF